MLPHSKASAILSRRKEETRMLSIQKIETTMSDRQAMGETNDCTVLALRSVTNRPYSDCHALLAAHGRKHRKGWNPCKLLGHQPRQTNTVMGHQFTYIGCDALRAITGRKTTSHVVNNWFSGPTTRISYNYPTVTQFAKANPRGTFYLCSRTHAYALVDGKMLDNGAAGRRTKVVLAWQVVNPNAAPTPVPAPAPTTLAAAVAATWTNPVVKTKRLQRDRVAVNGVEYRSVKAAFEALALPLAKHIAFRAALKAAGAAQFNGLNFVVVK